MNYVCNGMGVYQYSFLKIYENCYFHGFFSQFLSNGEKRNFYRKKANHHFSSDNFAKNIDTTTFWDIYIYIFFFSGVPK